MPSRSDSDKTKSATSNGQLPPGWRMVKFGDVVHDVNEAERNPLEAGLERYIGLEHIEPENLHIKSWGDLTQDEVSFTKRFRQGQVLFGKRRAYQRKVAVAEFDGICSSDILTFEPKDDQLLPELLPFIVQSDPFFEHALGTSSGSLSPRTRWSQLKDFEFPLPPKDEQQRITELLRAVDEVIHHFESVRVASLVVESSLFRHLFTKPGIGSDPSHSTPEIHVDGWKIASLESISEIITSGSRGWAQFYADEGPLFIRSQNVRNQELDFSDRQHVRPPIGSEIERTRVRPGDILITITGNSVGNVAFVPNNIGEAYISQHVALVRLAEPNLHPYVCGYFSPAGPGNNQILEAQYGQAKPGLSLIGIRKFQIPIPPPEELPQVLNVVKQMEAIKSRLSDHVGRLQALRRILRLDLLKQSNDIH